MGCCYRYSNYVKITVAGASGMKNMYGALIGIFCSLISIQAHSMTEQNEVSVDVRVADALVSESALGHLVNAFEESETARKKFIKSLLAECELTHEELAALKALVRDVRELLPVFFLLKNEYDRAYGLALNEALGREFATEISEKKGAVNSGKFTGYEICCEQYCARNWQVIDTVKKQFENDAKFARYFKTQEPLDDISDRVKEFMVRLASSLESKLAKKGDALKSSAALYAGLMFNQLADGLIEIADELQGNKA